MSRFFMTLSTRGWMGMSTTTGVVPCSLSRRMVSSKYLRARVSGSGSGAVRPVWSMRAM